MRPRSVHRNITWIRLLSDAYQGFRSLRPIVHLMGRPFAVSRRFVEIDITYRCNLACPNCNRSCAQAPSRMDLPVHRIEAFIAESLAQGFRWERIRVLGGEPTLHPEFMEILNRLSAYRNTHARGMRIVVCTNGSGRKVNRALSRLPSDIVIKNTRKTGGDRLFRPFNRAPVDSLLHRFWDYSAGCRIIEECGLGFTPLGYYPCAVAGGIDRIFGFGTGGNRLPAPEDSLEDLLRIFCPLCGHFGFAWPTRRALLSPVWKKAYSKAAQKNRGFHPFG